MHERCPDCGLVYEPPESDTYAMTYLGTAFFTGVFVLIVVFVPAPGSAWVRLVYLGCALAAMIGSMPRRKGLAVAVDYLTRRG
jgi:uncharacterized protein (DUF983 family)